jgi:dienelactone hydrolase
MKNLLFIILASFFTLEAHAACDGTVQTKSIPDPVNGSPFNIDARVYRPLVSAGQRFPVVFILPPVVGETPLDGALGITLCLNGVGAYILDVINDPSEAEQIQNLNVHEDTLIRAETSLNLWITSLKADPDVKTSFGILGASQGGIISAYLAGVIPDIKSSVIIAGGGNIAEILANSEQDSVKKLRQDRMAAFNLTTTKQYEDLVRPFITLEPLFVANNMAANSSLIFVLTRDTFVPTKNQRELVRAIAKPKVININNEHVPGIIQASTLNAEDIIKFFKDRL